MNSSGSIRLAAALLAAGVAALGGAPGAAAQAAPAPPPPSPSASDSAAMARARADSLRYPYTAADIQFMSGMIGHHAQAIKMAEWAPSHGANPSVRLLAERIINAQQDEIATMQHWLADRGLAVPEVTPEGLKMQMEGMTHVMLMPGMLTPAQMYQLDQARGQGFDLLFLRLMIQHHRGAIAMVKTLFDSYGAAQDQTVFKFASDVNIDQTTEVARMQKMLASLIISP